LTPANDIARQLVAEGFSDRPLEIHTEGLNGCLVWPSFHKAALRHFEENTRTPLHAIPWARVEAARERAKRARVQAPKEGVTGSPASPMASPLPAL